MSEYESAGEYGRKIRNNTSATIQEIVRDADGNARPLGPQVTAGVLIAQANLAIAASLAELADAVRSRP